jgi:cobaltochelatase CobS
MTTLANQIEFVKGAYAGMDAVNMLRSFMSIGRDALQADWFSARGILERTERDYRYFFKCFFDASTVSYIANLFSPEQIESFSNALYAKVVSMDEDTKAQFINVAHKVVNGNEILASIRGVKVDTAPAPKKEVFEVIEHIPAQEISEVKETIEAAPAKVEFKKDHASASFNLMLPLSEMIDSAVIDYVENKSGLLANVQKRIEAEAAKLRPNYIQIGERPAVEVKGRMHSAFKKALMLANLERQIFIAGEAGTGKTTLAAQIAEALALRFGHISCTAGMSEAHLLGRMDAHGNYLQSQFVDLYENGGVFLFDEVDAADSNTMLIINSALANGYMSVPNRKDAPTAKRHKDFICVCAANTWGFGSNEYAGRNILDATFLDRFTGSRLVVSYDMDLEQEIGKDFPEIVKAVWTIRENVKKHRIRRVVSTRAIVSGVRQRLAGIALGEFIDTFLTGWTAEEIKKAKEGI